MINRNIGKDDIKDESGCECEDPVVLEGGSAEVGDCTGQKLNKLEEEAPGPAHSGEQNLDNIRSSPGSLTPTLPNELGEENPGSALSGKQNLDNIRQSSSGSLTPTLPNEPASIQDVSAPVDDPTIDHDQWFMLNEPATHIG